MKWLWLFSCCCCYFFFGLRPLRKKKEERNGTGSGSVTKKNQIFFSQKRNAPLNAYKKKENNKKKVEKKIQFPLVFFFTGFRGFDSVPWIFWAILLVRGRGWFREGHYFDWLVVFEQLVDMDFSVDFDRSPPGFTGFYGCFFCWLYGVWWVLLGFTGFY